MLLLAAGDPMKHISDHPWPGWQVRWFGADVTLMSNNIASMILVAVILAAVIVPIARRRGDVPRGWRNLLEVIVIFVRDMIARPALQDRAYAFLPFLCTLFVFVLGMNLFGILPLEAMTRWLGEHIPWMKGKTIGGTATSVPTVCAGLASLSLLTIFACGLWRAAQRKARAEGKPMWLLLPLAPYLWLKSLSPNVPGPVGTILAGPLVILEVIGALAKCFALMIRLTANMMAGHILLAVLMMFAMQAAAKALEEHTLLLGVTFICALGGVAATMLDLLVAGLQAYIFTFLTAMFLGLYVEPDHSSGPADNGSAKPQGGGTR